MEGRKRREGGKERREKEGNTYVVRLVICG
jgi:hypothetical protein